MHVAVALQMRSVAGLRDRTLEGTVDREVRAQGWELEDEWPVVVRI